ncbi:MAG: hypothetical protein KJO40_20470 [Deltaproteobacteria bacterium]|nr:hypothetical protein [Deltaproteobacteria bacterium]NND27392.1 hypothetical protein [Myxococcales bacterium]MBT8465141.1 hypothetical protein [Deltaproteobacteria bacterium]MBT8480212.1 hypothetical protein [Deltaproteobacteria bacterium]NNK06265.1 hypothetical protein [Myxococcales bacterium]
MTDREDRLRSLLDKVRAKRPGERETHAAEAVDRLRAGSGNLAAAAPAAPLSDPPTSPQIESPTRYSSQPPRVERPLSVEPRARSSAPPSQPALAASPTQRPAAIRPQSVAPTGQPVVYATEQPEFPRPKTFGELLELTLSLRPR